MNMFDPVEEVMVGGEITVVALKPDAQPQPVTRWKLQDKVGDGNEHFLVSTVFLGRVECGGCYETMVFPKDERKEMECTRYETRAQAAQGHYATLRRWQDLWNARIVD